MEQQPYIYVYQTICEANGKSYVGIHKTYNLDDGYIGCGIYSQAHANRNQILHKAVRKYGYTSFRKYILSFYDSFQDALDEEKFIVNESWIKSGRNYNMALGGRGYLFGHLSKEEISSFYKGEKNHRYGKPAHNRKAVLQFDFNGNLLKRYESATEAAIETGEDNTNISNSCRGTYGQCGGFVFRYEQYTEKEMEQFTINLSKRKRLYNSDGTWSMTQDIKDKRKGMVSPLKGKKHSEETRLKMSQQRLGRKTKPCSEERKVKIGNANRGRKFNKELRKYFRSDS